MKEIDGSVETLVDFVTGQTVGDIGAERNRQAVERFLVTEKGFAKSDIAVDFDFELTVQGEHYRSTVDLVVSVDGTRFMPSSAPPDPWARGSVKSRPPPVSSTAGSCRWRWSATVQRLL